MVYAFHNSGFKLRLRLMRSRRRLIATSILSGILGIAAFGLLWFHNRYGVENIILTGHTFPRLELTDLAGETVDLDSFRGKKIIAVFLDLGCGYCQEQLKVLDAIHHQHGQDGKFSIVAVATYGSVVPRNFQSGDAFSFPLWMESKLQLREKLGTSAVPALFLIDEEGILLHKHVGYKAFRQVRGIIDSMVQDHKSRCPLSSIPRYSTGGPSGLSALPSVARSPR